MKDYQLRKKNPVEAGGQICKRDLQIKHPSCHCSLNINGNPPHCLQHISQNLSSENLVFNSSAFSSSSFLLITFLISFLSLQGET